MKSKNTPDPPAKKTTRPKRAIGSKKKASSKGDVRIPIVGIGASAGGLEALQQFIEHVPKGTGLAFVVIQHMDPTHKGLLVELLQRKTPMPVVQTEDRTKVEPGHVYVIPPNKDLSILHGVLHLLDPTQSRGLRLPIDFFFQSLADDMRDHSIGVILSGMGSDGTVGLRSIKDQGGRCFVQDPASAKCDGMPHSAIHAGVADVIVPAEELPGRILAFLSGGPSKVRQGEEISGKDLSGLEKIVILLRNRTGHDFSFYKRSTVYRRIERRMGLHKIKRIEDYVRYLQENPQEVELLFKELLIGVTNFFRDPAVWDRLKTEFIPELIAARPQGGTLRAWVPGCSTGEEAYSLAMVFKEALEEHNPPQRVSLQIFATDLDSDAIDKARNGLFPAGIASIVSEERLGRFFRKEDHGYRVSKEIREMVVFAQQNVISDPPFTKLDILTCRNLLIYLVPDLQKRLMALFHYSLNSGGVLLLGSAETVGGGTRLFTALGGRARLYRRSESSSSRADLPELPGAYAEIRNHVPAGSAPGESTVPPDSGIQTQANELLLQKYSPAAVLVTGQGDIVFINGKTGKYLEPAAGKANWNLFAMAREGLASPLGAAFHKAIRKKECVTLRNLSVVGTGGSVVLDVTVQPVFNSKSLNGMVLVVFEDVTAPTGSKAADTRKRKDAPDEPMVALKMELEQSREELSSAREEMQTSQEELQSTNEELQSTNEELTTSKEEMQSMNEELQTLNQELQTKVDDLTGETNDMQNLLNSTDIATLFLDSKLNVRRFTPQTARIIKLISGDVGRPVTDIVSQLDYPALADDAREVLRTLLFKEKQIAARGSRWFSVRIMPYRTHDDRIDGLVITFSDITVSKKLEAKLRATETRLRALLPRGHEEKSE